MSRFRFFCCKNRKNYSQVIPTTTEIVTSMRYNSLSYDRLLEKHFIQLADIGYTCLVHEEHLTLIRNDLINATSMERGWKIHISLDDEDADNSDNCNIKKAWNILVDIVIKYNIGLVKLVRHDYHNRDSNIHPNERGRQFTIYSRLDHFNDMQWKNILQEINTKLVLAGIRPGYRSRVCRPIAGSSYLTYRHDGTNDNYIAARGADSYNPLNVEDGYCTISIIPIMGQLPPKSETTCCCVM